MSNPFGEHTHTHKQRARKRERLQLKSAEKQKESLLSSALLVPGQLVLEKSPTARDTPLVGVKFRVAEESGASLGG